MCEGQRQQWEREKEQQKEQERMWQAQAEHWQLLQQQNEEQEQFWARQREQQKEQQDLLQKAVEQLQLEKRELLALRGKQAEEQWRWSQLKERHEKQQLLWQEEDMEQERKRSQWQEQLQLQEQRMEALRQEQQEQEERNTRWLQEQKEKQEEMEHLWETRWEQQLLRWRHQMQMQRLQVQKVKMKQQQMQKEEKALLPKLKVVEGAILDQFSKRYKIASPRKERRYASPSPLLSPVPSSQFDEDTYELESTWFPRLFTKAEEFAAPGTTEKRYWINIEAQRRNLEVLGEAVRKAGISPELYTLTKGIIKQALHSNVERLALLFRKYIAFRRLQQVRETLLIRLEAAKEAKDGVRMQVLYKMVDKLDAHQKRVMGHWTVKQMMAEKQRRRCLQRMIALFAQLRLSAKLQLTNPCPLLIKAGDRTKRESIHVPNIGPVFLKPRTHPSPLVCAKKQQDLTFSATIRYSIIGSWRVLL
uniref:FAM186A/B C-terminal domain-containing protein n=1 Tax=Podarcis muralis TaxID=64176 RepID=A0A670HZ59_PODMU